MKITINGVLAERKGTMNNRMTSYLGTYVLPPVMRDSAGVHDVT